MIFGESGGTSRLNVDEVNSQCDLVAEREAKQKIIEKEEKTKILYIFERVFENKDVPLRRKCILGSKTEKDMNKKREIVYELTRPQKTTRII